MKVLLVEMAEMIDHACLMQIDKRFPLIEVSLFESIQNAISAAPIDEDLLICASRETLSGDSIHMLQHMHARLPRATMVVIRATADLLSLISLFEGPKQAANTPMAATPRDAATSQTLSERENEVMALLCQGLQNKVIARRLGLSVSTVKTHLANIFRKLDVTTRLDAICTFGGSHQPRAEIGRVAWRQGPFPYMATTRVAAEAA